MTNETGFGARRKAALLCSDRRPRWQPRRRNIRDWWRLRITAPPRLRPPKSILNPVPSRGLGAGLRVVNRGGARRARDTASRPRPQIERMLGAAAGTDCLYDSLDMPVAVASLDVDAAAGIVRGEQYWRLPAATLPAEENALRRNRAVRWCGLPSLSHRVVPLRGLAN
jgi:hypothetical protein